MPVNWKTFCAAVFLPLCLQAQVTYYSNGALRQPDDKTWRAYLKINSNFVAGANVTLTVLPNGQLSIASGGGGGGGTVTSFSAGNLSPLFTTSVLNPATTPALSFSLDAQVANTIFAGPSGGPNATPTFRSLAAGDIPALAYVTSVGLSMPAEFSVANSPVTGADTLTVTKANQNANLFWAGPLSGAAAPPAFRAITAEGDLQIPALTNVVYGSNVNGTVAIASNALNVTATGIAGRFIRPVQTESGGTLYAAPQWPDNSVYEFDEEFDGGNTTSGQVGKYGWTVANAGNGQILTGNQQVETNAWGYLIMSAGGSAAQNVTSIYDGWPGASTTMPTINWPVLSNFQGAVVFYLTTTNPGTRLRMGFADARQVGPPNNGWWVGFDSATNSSFYFELRSGGSGTAAVSAAAVTTNEWHTCYFWKTNGNEMYFSIDGEAQVGLSGSLPTTQTMPTITFANTNNVVATQARIDRFAYRMTGLGRR